MPSPSPSIHTSVYIPRDLHLALRQRLLAEGKSLSQWVVEQIERELHEDGWQRG